MFIEIPASKASLSKRRLVHGVGVNDADYIVRPKTNNSTLFCPYYKTWSSMISRCYSKKLKERYPVYTECSSCDEWMVFSKFKSWMKKQDWQGRELDKDILIQGNKIYSPETCLFVDKKINVMFSNSAACRGSYPQGVVYHKQSGKFRASCGVNGSKKSLGLHHTPDQAFDAYKKFKYDIIKRVAMNQSEPLRSALLNYKIK